MAEATIYNLAEHRERRELKHLTDGALLSQLEMVERLLLQEEEIIQRHIEQHEALRVEARRRKIGGDALSFAVAWSPDDPA